MINLPNVKNFLAVRKVYNIFLTARNNLNKLFPNFLNQLTRKEPESFVSINLGNYYIKGLLVIDGKITDYFIRKNQALTEVIKEVWRDKKIPTDKVKLSIKNTSSLVRYFSFAKMDKKKLKQALFYELNKHIPFSPEEVYFDFSILEELNAQEVFLLLAAAKKDFIDRTLDVFEGEKLKVLEISLDSICLANLFLNNYKQEKEKNVCILDIGYSFSTLTILKKGMPFLTRDLEFNTKSIFEVISHVKNLPLENVEAWFFSLEDRNVFLAAAKSSILNLCKEIKNSFDYFEMNKGERLEKMYLTGGLACVKELTVFFRENLEIETLSLDYLNSFNIPFSGGKDKLYEHSFSAAVGAIL